MSDIDLTEAVDAAARAWFDHAQARRTDDGRHRPDGQPWTWDDQHAGDQFMMREIVLPIVAAAVPAVETQVRERIAVRVEAVAYRHESSSGDAFDDGFTQACDLLAETLRRGDDAARGTPRPTSPR